MKIANTLKLFSMGAVVSAAAYIAPVVVDKTAQTFGVNTGLVTQAYAQAKKKKTRKLPGISEATMKKLGVVTEFVTPDTEKNPDAKPDFQKALKELQKMERSCKDKCNKYELSQIYRFYAFAYYSLDDYPRAIGAYKKVVAQSPEIPIAVELDALYALAQLNFAQDNFDDSLKYLDRWIALSTVVGSDIFFLKGTILYTKGDKKGAATNVNKAISMVEANGKVAKEQWYSLQLALNLEKESYKPSKAILEKLIRNYPNVKYWTQFANVNGLLERESDQLHSLDAVYIQNKLKKRQDIVNLAYLYLGEDVPYKAAKVLEKGMAEKNVERNVKYLKVLASAWRAAREPKKAIAALNEAAKAAVKEDAAKRGEKNYKPEAGNIQSELVGLHLDLDDSKAAVEAGKRALRAGNLKRACEVHTNMGIAYVDMKQFKSAINSFDKAADDKQCRAVVGNWKKYAQNEQRQKEELERSL
ncbi:tetratricopeptide repeat protein [Agarilytica rhodophyticola]|uniref:tetratricopeptide repeat protein n=1 Tax=Agarilytica rhodophyticola TaxID=1737490 RepID=UPI000B3437B0|nr:tetratricopeptide repeat protein [Agarilytica rhodophyticola]